MGSCGYGDAALTYMKVLIERNIPLRWSPLVYTRWGLAPRHMLPSKNRPVLGDVETGVYKRLELMQCLEKDIEYDTVFLHSMPELWPKLVEPGKVNIGYTVWETDRLPRHWPEIFPCVDRLCVPCEFNCELFSTTQGPAVSVVPHAIRKPAHKSTKQDLEEYRSELGIAESMYIFYIIAAWDPRKAMHETLHAFLRAFDAEDNVCLLIKTDEKGCFDNSGRRKQVSEISKEIITGYSNAAKVVIIPDRIPEREIQYIHEIGDCFFSLTHCEGWGLGAFDAAASGNPVIITGWGGQLDYLPAENSYHVKYALKALQEIRGWESYDGRQKWAYADMDDAIRLLHHCYQNRNEAKEKGLQLQASVSSRFSIEQVTKSLLGAIDGAHSK